MPKRTESETDKGAEPDYLFIMKTRQGKRGKNKKEYHPYGEEFFVNRIVLIRLWV